MNEKEETIDLRVLLKVLTEHIIPIVIVTLLAAAIGFSLAKFFIPKRYTSEALMYVESSKSTQDDSDININAINAAQKLVNTCQILFTSDYVFGELSSRFGGAYTKEQLSGMIKIEAVNNTEVLKVSVVTRSPQESYDMANALVGLSIDEFHRIIKGGSIETVSTPTLPVKHTYPSTTRFTVIAALIGAAVSYFFFLVKELIDTKLKPEDDLTKMYDLPVYAEILDFENASRAGYKYTKYSSYDRKLQDEERIYSEEYETDIDKEGKTKAIEGERRENGKKERQTSDK